jgi:hypothetical protein
LIHEAVSNFPILPIGEEIRGKLLESLMRELRTIRSEFWGYLPD